MRLHLKKNIWFLAVLIMLSQSSALLGQAPAQYRYLSFENASIRATDTAMINDGDVYGLVKKGNFKVPRIVDFEHYKGSQSLCFEMKPDDGRADPEFGGTTTDKCQYNLTQDKGENDAYPPIHFGEDTYFGFAFKLAPSMEVPLQSTQLFQIWQGSSASPPFAIRLFGTNNNTEISMHIEYRNNETSGDNDRAITVYDTIVERGKWYSMVLMVNMRRTIDDEDGKIVLWMDQNKVLDVNARVGYSNGLPIKDFTETTSVNKYPRVEFGPYRGRNLTTFKAYYDEVKYANTFDLANPDADPASDIISPAANSSLFKDSTVTVQVNDVDDGSISKVEIYVNDDLVRTERSYPFTYDWMPASTGAYTIKAITYDRGNNAGVSEIQVNVIDVPGTSCSFGTPLATALPALTNVTYTHVYKFGTGGPDISNIKDFKIWWDPSNNALYNFELHTYNGSPDWFIDLRNKIINQDLNSSFPGITLANTGVLNFDGTYYAGFDNGNFVLADVSGNFTIYFSNASSAPSCNSGRIGDVSNVKNNRQNVVLNQTSGNIVLSFNENNVYEVVLFSSSGMEMNRTIIEGSNYEIQKSSLNPGIYIFHVSHEGVTDKIKFVVE